MAIYAKLVRLLTKDMVKDLNLREGQITTREQVSSWFESNYPKIKPSTISAHLLKMSTNAHSRIHYNMKRKASPGLNFRLAGGSSIYWQLTNKTIMSLSN